VARFVAVTGKTAPYQISFFCQTAFPLWDDVVKCGVFTQGFGAISAAVVPLGQDAVTEADLRFFPWDEFGLVNLVIHYHLAPGNIKGLDLRLLVW